MTTATKKSAPRAEVSGKATTKPSAPRAPGKATTTIPGLAAAIEHVYLTKPSNFPTPEVSLSDALGMWW